jgi:hypothetical protein
MKSCQNRQFSSNHRNARMSNLTFVIPPFSVNFLEIAYNECNNFVMSVLNAISCTYNGLNSAELKTCMYFVFFSLFTLVLYKLLYTMPDTFAREICENEKRTRYCGLSLDKVV